MRNIFVVIILMVAVSCSWKKKEVATDLYLEKQVINKENNIVFRIPEDWGVNFQNKSGSYVASKDGHGFETCRVGKLNIGPDVAVDENNRADMAVLDDYFLNHSVEGIEKSSKVKFLDPQIKKLSGLIIGGTHKKETGSGVAIFGVARDLSSRRNYDRVFYIIYGADTTRAGVECSMVGKDEKGKLLRVARAVAKSISYKNEYYE